MLSPAPAVKCSAAASSPRSSTAPQHRNPRASTLSAHFALWTAASAAVLAVASMTILHYRVVRAPQDAVILSERSESKNPDDGRSRNELRTLLHHESRTNHPNAVISNRRIAANRRDAQWSDPAMLVTVHSIRVPHS